MSHRVLVQLLATAVEPFALMTAYLLLRPVVAEHLAQIDLVDWCAMGIAILASLTNLAFIRLRLIHRIALAAAGLLILPVSLFAYSAIFVCSRYGICF